MLCCTQLRVYESESLPEMISYKQTKASILLPCSQYVVVETLSAFTQESIYSSSHYAQLKTTTSKYRRHIYTT